jgi:phosphomannomutase
VSGRPTDDELLVRARAWLEQDPDPETRDELSDLIAAAEGSSDALGELHSRFDERLAFGTAGLRGELAAGPNRMNRVLVAQAATGLAAFLLETAGGGVPSVVIGYDGRKNSAVFAGDTAELMAGAGVRAILLPRLLPTPVLAFAVRHLGASAGVMVTASHNPPRDNGYKVYLGGFDNGSQIVPPADGAIAAHILRVAEGSVADLPRSEAYETADESVVDAYIAASAAVASGIDAAAEDEPLRVVYTAMHGVGWETAKRVFEAAGIPVPTPVAAQIDPDPAFPTVAFPNPEEPGAMDLSFERARGVGADLVVANDPDADRLAIAIPDDSAESGYRRLSGNEVGALLGWKVAEDAYQNGDTGVLAASIVSSPALAAVAAAYDQDFVETLTGFKWVSRVPGLIFGFEEALGYLVNPETVRDKDGISAAALFLAHAGELQQADSSIASRLDDFSAQFGHFASDQISVRVTELSEITAMMTRLRQSPPAAIGDIRVRQIDDLADGFGTLPPSDVLRIWLEDGSRVVVRPSGTEPKLKAYIDASSDRGTVAERRAAAESRVQELGAGIRSLLA